MVSSTGNFLTGDVKRILVPVDFSPKSSLALRHAVELARFYGASIWLLHVLDMVAFMGGTVPGVLQDIRVRCESALEAMADSVRKQDFECTALLRSGDLDGQIQETIERDKIDVLVLATTAGTSFAGFSLASTAERILRKTMIPVLAVSACRPLRQWSSDGCIHILYATDLSPESLHTASYARALQKRFCARFTLAHVLPKHAPAEKIEAVTAQLKALAAGSQSEVEVLTGKVGPCISEAASRAGADLIVVGVKKHSVLREILLGHTLLEILYGSCCPVMTVRQ